MELGNCAIERPEGVEIRILLQPRASNTEIVGLYRSLWEGTEDPHHLSSCRWAGKRSIEKASVAPTRGPSTICTGHRGIQFQTEAGSYFRYDP
jgi:hypothetical protein